MIHDHLSVLESLFTYTLYISHTLIVYKNQINTVKLTYRNLKKTYRKLYIKTFIYFMIKTTFLHLLLTV